MGCEREREGEGKREGIQIVMVVGKIKIDVLIYKMSHTEAFC
jgi:hypothetical protein